MRAFERQVAELECHNVLFSYPYQVKPITDQAIAFFAIHGRDGGPIPKNKTEFEKNLKLDRYPFKGSRAFYYDDPNESEDERIKSTKNLAVLNMADRHVPGIYHIKSIGKNPYIALTEGTDYEIEVSEKIVHEQPKKLSFDDIKAL
ncbi:hypothetical protein M3152_08350 [Sporosarcina luteola]|uniref:hypothetical protein n=1 Tax=Sporosarcina luteola TaxID=582850 RepID=UPI00203E1986|nr:hypothetical protein [Sporosarcina luteola]MCM3637731.1 hypothetical protein [Sporosarcina luteola]